MWKCGGSWEISWILGLVSSSPHQYKQLIMNLKLSLLLIFQLEKSLKSQIDAWEQENGTEFLVNGQQFLVYVQQQWEKHHEEKEREKLERVCLIL